MSDRYFKGTSFIFKFLRLLNLLEPGKAVISLSKLFVYVSLFVLIYVVMNSPDNIVAVLGATSTNVMALLNYVHRRNKQLPEPPPTE